MTAALSAAVPAVVAAVPTGFDEWRREDGAAVLAAPFRVPFDADAVVSAEWRCVHEVGSNVWFEPVVTVKFADAGSPPYSFESDGSGGVVASRGEFVEYARGFIPLNADAVAWLGALCEALWATTDPPVGLLARYA